MLQNTDNSISVDAPQTAELDMPFYFFSFAHPQTQKTFEGYFTRNNLSSERFGQFNIILPDDLDMTNGQYKYQIFENVNNVDTDKSLMNLLESGFTFVADDPEQDESYTPPTKEAKVHGND